MVAGGNSVVRSKARALPQGPPEGPLGAPGAPRVVVGGNSDFRSEAYTKLQGPLGPLGPLGWLLVEFLPFQANMPSQIGWRLNRTELTHKNYRSSQTMAEAEIASYQQNGRFVLLVGRWMQVLTHWHLWHRWLWHKSLW